MGSLKETARIGATAMPYFEICSTLALVRGLVVVNVVKPGAGMNIDPSTLDASSVSNYTAATQHHNTAEFLMNIVPNTVVGAFAQGEMLRIIFFALLFAFALSHPGKRVAPLVEGPDMFLQDMFGMVRYVMYVAPIGAFGGIALTIARYGIGTLASCV